MIYHIDVNTHKKNTTKKFLLNMPKSLSNWTKYWRDEHNEYQPVYFLYKSPPRLRVCWPILLCAYNMNVFGRSFMVLISGQALHSNAGNGHLFRRRVVMNGRKQCFIDSLGWRVRNWYETFNAVSYVYGPSSRMRLHQFSIDVTLRPAIHEKELSENLRYNWHDNIPT